MKIPIRLKITRESKNSDRENSLKITPESKNYGLKIPVRACMRVRMYSNSHKDQDQDQDRNTHRQNTTRTRTKTPTEKPEYMGMIASYEKKV